MALLSSIWQIYDENILSQASQSTRSASNGRWNNHIQPCLGSKEVSDITTFDIFEFQKSLLKKNLSQQTIHHCLSLTRTLLRRAIDWNLFDGPVPRITMPKFDNRRVRYLTSEEAAKLLDILKSKSLLWHDIAVFALNTGLRRSEIFNLQQVHVDIRKNREQIVVLDTKTSRNRIVSLNQVATEVVKKYISKSATYLFQTCNGTKLTSVSKIFFIAVKESGLNSGITDRRQKVVFHTLRHTFATWLIEQGVDIGDVSKILGHSNLDMTMRYVQFYPQHSKAAVNKLDAYFMK